MQGRLLCKGEGGTLGVGRPGDGLLPVTLTRGRPSRARGGDLGGGGGGQGSPVAVHGMDCINEHSSWHMLGAGPHIMCAMLASYGTEVGVLGGEVHGVVGWWRIGASSWARKSEGGNLAHARQGAWHFARHTELRHTLQRAPETHGTGCIEPWRSRTALQNISRKMRMSCGAGPWTSRL